MRLVLANDKLVVAGRSFPGFPLLLNDDGDAMEPAQTFLWHLLAHSGQIESKATWKEYGRALYDFFAYVYRNSLDWKRPAGSGMPSAVHAYRDWSKGILGLESGTINMRLRIVVRFYRWAQEQGHIQELPFHNILKRSGRPPGLLFHVDTSGGKIESPDILLRNKKSPIKFLVKEQVGVCLGGLGNITHRLMFELMTRTGLRQIECRTFPEKYLFDPRRRTDLTEGQKIRVQLNPTDMKIKFNKPREIDIPFNLMEDLWLNRHEFARHPRASQNTAFQN